MNASFEYGWRPCHSPGTAGSCTCSPWCCRRFATSTLASLPLILMLNWPHESTHSSRCSVARWLRRPVVEVPPEYFWTESSLPKACNLLETKKMSQLVDMRWEANLLAEYTCALWAILLEKRPYISSNMTFSIPSWAHMMTGTVMTMQTSSWRASTIYSHGCLWSLKAMGYESLSATARSNGCRGCIVEIEPFVIRMTVAVSRHWFVWCRNWRDGGKDRWRLATIFKWAHRSILAIMWKCVRPNWRQGTGSWIFGSRFGSRFVELSRIISGTSSTPTATSRTPSTSLSSGPATDLVWCSLVLQSWWQWRRGICSSSLLRQWVSKDITYHHYFDPGQSPYPYPCRDHDLAVLWCYLEWCKVNTIKSIARTTQTYLSCREAKLERSTDLHQFQIGRSSLNGG